MAFVTLDQMAVFEATMEGKFKALEGRALESIKTAIVSMGTEVQALVSSGWTTANAEFEREQAAVRVSMQEMKQALEATSAEGLIKAAAEIMSIGVDREAEKLRLSILLQDIKDRCDATANAMNSRINALEHSGPRAGGDYDGASTSNSRAPRLRIPDPSGWKLKEMAGKGDSWGVWREAFELQVGSVWPGLDQMLMKIRDISHETRVEKVRPRAHDAEVE